MSNVSINVRRFRFQLAMLVFVLLFLMQAVGCGNNADTPSQILGNSVSAPPIVAIPDIEGPINGGMGSTELIRKGFA